MTLFAGDKKLHEWSSPPYAFDLPTARLAGQEFVRASVIDETGYEAADLLFLSGDRFIEQIDVNLVELPVSVSDSARQADRGPRAEELHGLREREAAEDRELQLRGEPADLRRRAPRSLRQHGEADGGRRRRRRSSSSSASSRRTTARSSRAFAGDPARNAPFVVEVATLESQVNAIPKPAGGTALYDAIITGLYRFRNVQGRKALIVITDGEDTTSRMAYDEMLTYARASRVPLYFIGIGFVRSATRKMKSLAAETGGVAYFIRNVEQLGETYRKLEQDLRSQYLLSYQTESSKNDTDVPDRWK